MIVSVITQFPFSSERLSVASSGPTAFDFGALPVNFEANRGQTDSAVDYLSAGPGYELFLNSNEATLVMQATSATGRRDNEHRTNALHMKLNGANPRSHGVGLKELGGKKNYLMGNDPTKWRRDIPLFDKVKFSETYPGIDVVYYGTQRPSSN